MKSIVVGVGGFLGIGEKSVAIDFPKLSWMEANGDRWLVTEASKEQLEALPEFDQKLTCRHRQRCRLPRSSNLQLQPGPDDYGPAAVAAA